MAETTLTNVGKAVGQYDSIETYLESDPLDTLLLSGLKIEKIADKEVWATGELTYTVTITNEEDVDYTGVKFTDTLDKDLVVLVTDSVEINGAAASYTFEESSGLLTVDLPDDIGAESVEITFQVTKK